MELTKDSDKLICSAYKNYLERRKSGESKLNAKHFKSGFYKEIKALASWNEQDVRDTLAELKRANFVKLYIDGGFQLNDSAIIYMENRFKNGLADVTEFLSKFIP